MHVSDIVEADLLAFEDELARRRAAAEEAIPHAAESEGEEPGPGEYRLTELGNAQRLADANVSRLRFVHDWKAWLVWDGSRWKRDSGGAEDVAAKEIVDQLFALAETSRTQAVRLSEIHADLLAAGDNTDRAAEARDARAKAQQSEGYKQTKRAIGAAGSMERWAMMSSTAKVISNMVKLARSEPRLIAVPGELDADRWVLNVKNGTLDLREGELRPHRQSDMITKMAGAGYDPDARAPRWERFLEEVQPDPEMRAWLQRFMGYCLTGSISEQVMLFALGVGNNGKNVMLDTMLAVMGDYAMTGAPDLLVLKHNDEHPTAFADLHGHRLVVVSEIDRGRKWAEATIKRLTGDEWITARRMRQDFYRFRATHKFIVMANSKPEVSGTDNGIWRRMRLAPFGVTIPKEKIDQGLLEALRSEIDGILAWAVRGCLAWQRSGLGSPRAVSEAVEKYRREQDVVGEWYAERCVCTCALNARAPGDDGFCGVCHALIRTEAVGSRDAPREPWHSLYPDFRSWQEARGEPRPWSLVAFRAELLKRHWLQPYRSKSERGLDGIALRYLPGAGVSTRTYYGTGDR